MSLTPKPPLLIFYVFMYLFWLVLTNYLKCWQRGVGTYPQLCVIKEMQIWIIVDVLRLEMWLWRKKSQLINQGMNAKWTWKPRNYDFLGGRTPTVVRVTGSPAMTAVEKGRNWKPPCPDSLAPSKSFSFVLSCSHPTLPN